MAMNDKQKQILSRSLRARGLKHFMATMPMGWYAVALFTGAWIETALVVDIAKPTHRRALYGRVD